MRAFRDTLMIERVSKSDVIWLDDRTALDTAENRAESTTGTVEVWATESLLAARFRFRGHHTYSGFGETILPSIIEYGVPETQRWHAHRRTAGNGHLYQGRYKSFPVQSDEHLLTVCRYVERNALRANLVEHAEEWKWGSLSARRANEEAERPTLTPWPIDRPRDWIARVSRPFGTKEEEAMIRSMRRGQPFGSESWKAEVAARLGLESLLRPTAKADHENSPTTAPDPFSSP